MDEDMITDVHIGQHHEIHLQHPIAELNL